MYLRWKRRRNSSWRGWYYVLDAVLVASCRVEGKPRQKYIKHLGTVPDWWAAYDWTREGFEKRIAELKEEDISKSVWRRGSWKGEYKSMADCFDMRIAFWNKVDERLSELELDAKQKASIKTKIAEQTKPLSEEEKAFRNELLETWDNLVHRGAYSNAACQALDTPDGAGDHTDEWVRSRGLGQSVHFSRVGKERGGI